MESFITAVAAVVEAHHQWAGPILFLVCFGESLAGVSLLVPASAILLAAGTLIPSGVLQPLPLILWSVAGAVLGDAVSYWVGLRLGPAAHRLWPFSRHPALLENGIRFFERHGGKSVFIARFIGPLRAVVPLVAGMMAMSSARFWIANVASAVIWAPAVLLPGAALAEAATQAAEDRSALPTVFAALLAAGVLAYWVARRNGWLRGI